MKKLIAHVLWSLWNDEQAAKRWLFGLFSSAVTLASMVFVDGVEAAFAWTHKQWAAKLLTAAIAMVFGMVNPTGKVPQRPPDLEGAK